MAVKIQLTITVDDNGRPNVSGPIHDKLLCYGLLEIAKETIAEHHRRAAEGKGVVLASAPAAAMIGGRQGGN